MDGISAKADWDPEFPGGEAKILWKAELGTGFSSFSVVGGKLYTMGNRDDRETVWCLDALSGELVWKHEYDCPLDPKYFEGGPTSTPTVEGGRVYTLSRRGQVFVFDAAGGDLIWGRDLADEHGLPMPSWGFSGSPLVVGDKLILNLGASGVAVAKADGEVLWISDPEEAGYSSPLLVERGKTKMVLLGRSKSWAAIDLEEGEEVWSQRWLTRYGVNAADPILVDGGAQVLISSGYGKGAALLGWPEEGDEPEVIWQNKSLRSQMNPAVLVDGHLYGVDGDAGTANALKCIELGSGEEKWSVEKIGTGGVTVAGGRLIVLSARGELIIAPVSPEGFEPISRAQVLGGKCWTVPVLSNGLIYCRNAEGEMVCVDVRE